MLGFYSFACGVLRFLLNNLSFSNSRALLPLLRLLFEKREIPNKRVRKTPPTGAKQSNKTQKKTAKINVEVNFIKGILPSTYVCLSKRQIPLFHS